MRKWKCTVCGYIHTGDEPPATCPVCGAPKNRFVEVSADGTPKPAPAAPAQEPTATVRDEKQPRGQAAMEAENKVDRQRQRPHPEPQSRFKDSKYRVVFEMMTQYHGHPISVHIPNGLLPVAVLFIFLSAIFSLKGMAGAAVYNLGVVALSMPLVLFSGWVDWQNRFNGAITNVFTVKIACGIIVTVSAWFLFLWLLINPEVVTTSQPSRVAFLINLIMLGAAGTAGWYGGKLVFRD